jgi:hypothetical protein
MVNVTGGILDGSENVFVFQRWVILQDLLETSACAEKIEDVGHTNSKASNAGASATLGIVDGYSGGPVSGHRLPISCYSMVAGCCPLDPR